MHRRHTKYFLNLNWLKYAHDYKAIWQISDQCIGMKKCGYVKPYKVFFTFSQVIVTEIIKNTTITVDIMKNMFSVYISLKTNAWRRQISQLYTTMFKWQYSVHILSFVNIHNRINWNKSTLHFPLPMTSCKLPDQDSMTQHQSKISWTSRLEDNVSLANNRTKWTVSKQQLLNRSAKQTLQKLPQDKINVFKRTRKPFPKLLFHNYHWHILSQKQLLF